MTSALLIFPHQLFLEHPGFTRSPQRIGLIEHPLFFGDRHVNIRFHKQKIWVHRATMMHYAHQLRTLTSSLDYVDHRSSITPLMDYLKRLAADNIKHIIVAAPHDFLLEQRLRICCHRAQVTLEILPSPMFLNTTQQNQGYRKGKKRWFMADFYKYQRRRLNLLMDEDQPVGGKWSFDEKNRKKVPKRLLHTIPALPEVQNSEWGINAKEHVLTCYADHPGSLDKLLYPITHAHAQQWLQQFLDERFTQFGDYEDAIVAGENTLWHAVLTPMLNIGLLTPKQVIDAAMSHAETHEIPLNSLEGFVRQIIGWREFMRATYEDLGVAMRTTNHWQHHRPIPQSFYDGTTGIDPIDDAIRRVNQTGYCHHIERLMVLGGFMFLCEFDPKHIYRWFMELFVDSYDWVMVPNVFAMSQHADGGLITTKPYFSGSAYVRKMSHYKTGPWSDIWDGLYWRWIHLHSDDLSKNPRWAMMCAMARKMPPEKREQHLLHANRFLDSL